jgi:hypothetical protein
VIDLKYVLGLCLFFSSVAWAGEAIKRGTEDGYSSYNSAEACKLAKNKSENQLDSLCRGGTPYDCKVLDSMIEDCECSKDANNYVCIVSWEAKVSGMLE